ncbi:MAG: FAD-dependent oxidoreductase [Pseudomonadota bacterium]
MESFAPDLRQTTRVPLQASHVDALRQIGAEIIYDAGDIVFEIGDPVDKFIYIVEGRIEVIDPITREAYLPTSLGPTQFVGEVAFLFGGTATMPLRAAERTKALVASREDVLALMAQIPEMGDIIINVLNMRRRRQLDENDSSLIIIGAEQSRALREIEAFVSRNRLGYRGYQLGSPDAIAAAKSCNAEEDQPIVIFGQQGCIENPTPRRIAGLLGLDLQASQDVYDVLIVGGGPAGVAAGVYAGAEGMSAVVVDEIAIGGQAGTSSRIENYMGFPTGISGADLLWRGEVQAMKFGTQFAMPRRIQGLRCERDGTFTAEVDNCAEIRARSIVVATGVQYRKLPLENLATFEGNGVYYAATETESRFCSGTEVAVIGGGNSAGQAAMFLCRTADHVHVFVRGTSLAASMSDYLSERLEAEPNITLHFQTEVSALHGGERLAQITQRCRKTGVEVERDLGGLFIMVGAAPNTDWLKGLIEMDSKGFILTGSAIGKENAHETSRPGIYAVGDVRAGSIKRVASAVGEGSVVISQAWQYVHADAPASV